MASSSHVTPDLPALVLSWFQPPASRTIKSIAGSTSRSTPPPPPEGQPCPLPSQVLESDLSRALDAFGGNAVLGEVLRVGFGLNVPESTLSSPGPNHLSVKRSEAVRSSLAQLTKQDLSAASVKDGAFQVLELLCRRVGKDNARSLLSPYAPDIFREAKKRWPQARLFFRVCRWLAPSDIPLDEERPQWTDALNTALDELRRTLNNAAVVCQKYGLDSTISDETFRTTELLLGQCSSRTPLILFGGHACSSTIESLMSFLLYPNFGSDAGRATNRYSRGRGAPVNFSNSFCVFLFAEEDCEWSEEALLSQPNQPFSALRSCCAECKGRGAGGVHPLRGYGFRHPLLRGATIIVAPTRESAKRRAAGPYLQMFGSLQALADRTYLLFDDSSVDPSATSGDAGRSSSSFLSTELHAVLSQPSVGSDLLSQRLVLLWSLDPAGSTKPSIPINPSQPSAEQLKGIGGLAFHLSKILYGKVPHLPQFLLLSLSPWQGSTSGNAGPVPLPGSPAGPSCSAEDTYRFLGQITEELGTRFLDYRVTKAIRLLLQLESRLQLATMVFEEKRRLGDKKVPLSVVLSKAVEGWNGRKLVGAVDREWNDGGGLTVEDGEFILSGWSSWQQSRGPPSKPNFESSLEEDLRWITIKSTPTPSSLSPDDLADRKNSLRGGGDKRDANAKSLFELYGLLHRCQDPFSVRVTDTLSQLLSIVAPNGLPELALEIGEQIFEKPSAPEKKGDPIPTVGGSAEAPGSLKDAASMRDPRKGRTLLSTLNASAVTGAQWADSCLSSKALCRSPSSPITPTYRQSGYRGTTAAEEGEGKRRRGSNWPNLMERAKCEQAEWRYRQSIEDAELLQFSTFLAPLSKKEMDCVENDEKGENHDKPHHKRSHTM